MTAPKNKGKGRAVTWLRDHVGYASDECLTWPLAHDGRGYGSMGHNGKHYKAHRLMCELAHGAPPSPEHQAAHSCGRGHLLCVNPRHLSWKTPKENMADCVAHGNARTDRGRPRVKLTVEQVQEILALRGTKTQEQLAAIYGVTWRQIGKIQRGTSWRDGKLHNPGFAPGDPNNIGLRKIQEMRRRQRMASV